ncbi:MAG: response regulator [Betaproteobacteria bacterium]
MSSSPQQKLRALVVDDDDTVIDFLTQVLHRMNFTVEHAFDGLDALRRCQSARYDLVVCDVRMPRLSGLSLLSNLAHTPNVDTRIVMISALDDDSLRRQSMASGATHYLIKPLTAEMLRGAITGIG